MMSFNILNRREVYDVWQLKTKTLFLFLLQRGGGGHVLAHLVYCALSLQSEATVKGWGGVRST